MVKPVTRQSQLPFEIAQDEVLLEAPAGTWLNGGASYAHYREYLAQACARTIPGPPFIETAFHAGFAAAISEIVAAQQRLNLSADQPCRVREFPIRTDNASCEAFAQWCLERPDPTAEFRIRADHFHMHCACYMESLGTLILRTWRNCAASLLYCPGRAVVMREHFRDRAAYHESSARIWYSHCCAQRIAHSLEGPPRVSPFDYNGRRYLNLSNVSSGSYCECEAWQLRAACDWPYRTFTPSDLRRAWDDGTIERGNERGLLVIANQQHCVLDSCAVFFDHNALPLMGDSVSGVDESDESDPESCDEAESVDTETVANGEPTNITLRL